MSLCSVNGIFDRQKKLILDAFRLKVSLDRQNALKHIDDIQEVVDRLNADGEKVGMVQVFLYRPLV